MLTCLFWNVNGVAQSGNRPLVPSEPQQMTAAMQTLLDDSAKAREPGETDCCCVHARWTLNATTDRLNTIYSKSHKRQKQWKRRL